MGLTDGGTGTRLGCFVQTLTYTGNGSTSYHIDTTIHPLWVRIWQRETVDRTDIVAYETTNTIIDDHANGMSIKEHANLLKVVTDHIISLDANGFTVDDGGADEHPNKNGQVYNVLVLGY